MSRKVNLSLLAETVLSHFDPGVVEAPRGPVTVTTRLANPMNMPKHERACVAGFERQGYQRAAR